MRIQLIAISVLLAASAAGQDPRQSASDAPILGRPLGRWTFDKDDVDQSVITALSRAGVPGGITTRSKCNTEAKSGINSLTEGLTLNEALILLKTANPLLDWHVARRGLLRVNLSPNTSPILSVIVRSIRFDSRNLDLSIDSLIHTDEVQAAAARLRVELMNPPLGIYSLSKDRAAGQPPAELIELSNVSVEDVLNEIAERNGKAVWELSERLCDSVPSITFAWRVR
jgi:hypothetical protein